MTNHYIDFRNADVILNMGGNVAENHPVSFKWIQAARNKGRLYPRGSPIYPNLSESRHLCSTSLRNRHLLPGGMIKYILDNTLYDEFYVKHYTNASFIVSPRYGFDDGLFSGYNPHRGPMTHRLGLWKRTKMAFPRET